MDAVFPRLRRLLAWVSPLFPKYQPSGQITCTATGNKPTCSKPESAREAPARVKHPFQQACVLRAKHLSARMSGNTMYSTTIKHNPSASNICHRPRPKVHTTHVNNAVDRDSHAATGSAPWDSHVRRAAFGHCVQNELHKETGKKRNQITSFLLTLLLCLFARGFANSLLFLWLSTFDAVQCNFPLVAAQVHGYPSVLGLCVSFLLSLRLPLHGFYDDKIAHMWGAIAFISGRLFSLLAAMHAAFHGLLHASALI